MFMTNWHYKRCLKTMDDMEKCENELHKAIERLLWEMRGICVKHKLEKKLTQKEKKSLLGGSFCFRNGISYAIDTNLIFIQDVDGRYGEVIGWVVEAGIPTSWLWRKNWQDDFIKEYVIQATKEQEEWRKEEAEASYERYKALDKIYGKVKK